MRESSVGIKSDVGTGERRGYDAYISLRLEDQAAKVRKSPSYNHFRWGESPCYQAEQPLSQSPGSFPSKQPYEKLCDTRKVKIM